VAAARQGCGKVFQITLERKDGMAETTQHPLDAESGLPRRTPYEPPGISWEEPFEMKANLASACDKIGGQSFECNAAPAS
jgi:hypothetical protein